MSVREIFTCDVCRQQAPMEELDKSETLMGGLHVWRRGERKGYAYPWPLGIGRNRSGKRNLCNDCCCKAMRALGLDEDGRHALDEKGE